MSWQSAYLASMSFNIHLSAGESLDNKYNKYHHLKEQYDTGCQTKDLFYMNGFMLYDKSLEYKIARSVKALGIMTILWVVALSIAAFSTFPLTPITSVS